MTSIKSISSFSIFFFINFKSISQLDYNFINNLIDLYILFYTNHLTCLLSIGFIIILKQMYLFKKNQIIHLILASIIPFLIWGPFFPDLIVSLSSLIFLFYVIKNKDFYYLNNKPFIIFIIFCLYCIFVTLLRAEDKLLSFESSLFYFRIGLFSCLIWYLIDQDKNILKYFYYSLIICFTVLVIDGYFQFFTGSNILGFKYSGRSYFIFIWR